MQRPPHGARKAQPSGARPSPAPPSKDSWLRRWRRLRRRPGLPRRRRRLDALRGRSRRRCRRCVSWWSVPCATSACPCPRKTTTSTLTFSRCAQRSCEAGRQRRRPTATQATCPARVLLQACAVCLLISCTACLAPAAPGGQWCGHGSENGAHTQQRPRCAQQCCQHHVAVSAGRTLSTRALVEARYWPSVPLCLVCKHRIS